MSGIIRLEPAHARIAAALHGTSFAAPWSEQEFAKLLEQPGVAGLMWNPQDPQGFILIRAVADEAEILTLAVAPAERRKGIAAGLLERACRMLRAGGTHRLFLEVAADNAAARALYNTYGFSETGRRAAYYDRGSAPKVDAIIMSLDLAPRASAAAHH
ncbi:MAG: ribosomal protein S18-alanine N-acetyltransferase [Rhodospirillaceae bacterium]